MRSTGRLLTAFALSVLGTSVAGSQQFRGVVVDSAARAPLPGAVITVVDSSGATAGRAITDAAGRFTVTLAPSATRLRLIRIGYRPRDVAVPPPGAQRDAVLQLAMDRLPPMLGAVRVTGSELCPGSTDRGAAFQLWEQARAGLLATVVARQLKPAKARTLVYESGMSPGDERIRRQTKSIKTGQTSRPFTASGSPSFFAHFGYMIEDSSGRVYSAPDADILVHDSFAATHCFRLEPADDSHKGQLGLSFTPISGRDTLVDVKGVIWIDGQTPQLRSLDFLYTSLESAAMQIRPGGHIEFRAMENGVAFIERWSLRLPSVQVTTGAVGEMTRRPLGNAPIRRSERYDARVVEIVEAGGIVLDASWADGAHWSDAPAVVRGVVAQRRTGAPLAHGMVTLLGTPDTVRTSETGEFEIAGIPGKYLIVATDTTLVNFVAPRSESMSVELARGTVVPVRLEVAPMEGVIAEVCRGQKIRENTTMLIGLVRLTGKAIPRNARVHAVWQADYTKDAISGVQISENAQEVDLDDRGRFVVCGVARERPIKLSLRRGRDALGDTTVQVITNTYAHPVEWIVGGKATPP